MIKQRTPEWYEARRAAISSTDIPVILGLSPYTSEADLAREKSGDPLPVEDRQARAMRLGLALEPVVKAEEELEHGFRLRHVDRLLRHPTIEWAITSLDYERVGQKCIVEVKTSRAARWDDGLPQDVEAQVRWQMGVARYPRAHVAALLYGADLACYDLEHDEATFQALVAIARDFLDRLAAGGPYQENAASVRRRYPFDSGAEMVADDELTRHVTTLLALRDQRKRMEVQEEAIETAIQARMGEVSLLTGPGFRVTWKRTKDGKSTDWKAVAEGALAILPEAEASDLVGRNTTDRPGFRPFRVVATKENK